MARSPRSDIAQQRDSWGSRDYDAAMAASYPCPRCGEEVPTHFIFSGQLSTGPTPEPPQFQHQECSRCKARLYRATSIPDQSWRLDPKIEQRPWDG
jgi:hypothetical protein